MTFTLLEGSLALETIQAVFPIVFNGKQLLERSLHGCKIFFTIHILTEKCLSVLSQISAATSAKLLELPEKLETFVAKMFWVIICYLKLFILRSRIWMSSFWVLLRLILSACTAWLQRQEGSFTDLVGKKMPLVPRNLRFGSLWYSPFLLIFRFRTVFVYIIKWKLDHSTRHLQTL